MAVLGISLLNILIWVIFGFIIGFIIHKIDPGDVKGGIVMTIVFGIGGAILGGFLSLLLFHVAAVGFSIQGFITALVGGFILAGIHRVLFRGHDTLRTTTTQLR